MQNDKRSRLYPLAVAWLGSIALAKILLHLIVIERYGYFRDELYYLASTEHLSWGYVDHPPFSIALLALVRASLGDGLPAVRIVPVLAGAGTVFLCGVIARQLGGGRFAQVLAALAGLLSPVFLGLDHFYSMNALELLFWTAAAWATLRALESRRKARRWLILGAILGIGLLNKLSMSWFAGGLVVGLLLTEHRRVLRERGIWLAAALAFVIFLPHLLWQMTHGWPTFEFMRNATSIKMADVSPAAFLLDQVLTNNPGAVPVWLAGIVFGFTPGGRRGRVLVWIYLTVLLLLLAGGHSRASYLAPAYPMLFALGGVAIERQSAAGRDWVRPVALALLVIFGVLVLPLALPVLPVQTFVRYQAALGQSPRTEETQDVGSLPQHFADMFGWEEMTDLVAEAYSRLTPEEQARARVFGQNYGEAGAIDVLGRRRGLPPALSGHNSYWMWGPGTDSVTVLIIIGGDREDNAEFFEEIEVVGQTSSPWAMPYERGLDISIARKPRVDLREAWPNLRMFI